uniref:hypothetical protein n=1 Tax=Flavobacterium sp. TaxID=239 RepID=UPI00404AE467
MKEKYAKITSKILTIIPLFFIFLAIDQFILPENKIIDNLTEYNKIEVTINGSYGHKTKEFLGYKYYTKKGFEFSLNSTLIKENEVEISQSYIFKNINKVTSKNKDYTNELMSGWNGACFYTAIGIIITAILSLLSLKFNSNLTENGFHNIILINSFLILVFLYFQTAYN